IAAGLGARGVRAGDRACLFLRPGIELVAVTYALFLLGAVPVLADPGMGRKQLLACMARVKPSVLIGIPRAQLARLFWRAPFSSVRLFVTVGKKLFWSGPTLAALE